MWMRCVYGYIMFILLFILLLSLTFVIMSILLLTLLLSLTFVLMSILMLIVVLQRVYPLHGIASHRITGIV